MMSLRILSLLAGALVLILPPILLGGAGTGNVPGAKVAFGLFLLAVMSASFVYAGMVGKRMRRNGPERMRGGVLLAVPILSGLVGLFISKDAPELWCSGALLAVSLLLFLSFVFPGFDARRRPMRGRERTEPVLVMVQRQRR